jgi:hypothetical protein
MLSSTHFSALRELQASELAAPQAALMHHVISFHFKAHPRFLEAASFAWPSASWHFTH